jgi:hypothetical protein
MRSVTRLGMLFLKPYEIPLFIEIAYYFAYFRNSIQTIFTKRHLTQTWKGRGKIHGTKYVETWNQKKNCDKQMKAAGQHGGLKSGLFLSSQSSAEISPNEFGDFCPQSRINIMRKARQPQTTTLTRDDD